MFALASRIIIGGMPFSLAVAHAQTSNSAPAAADAARQNEEVLRAWKQQSGSAVELKTDGDGGTKIEFHGEVKLDTYNKDVSAPAGSGNLLTPNTSGNFANLVTRGDLRITSEKGEVTYAQGTVTATNDRTVLSHYPNQLTNFQMGRTGQGYQWMLGDVAVNYSQLSSNLGLRGFYGTMQFDRYTLSGHAGVVAESWEALADRDTLDGTLARTRYLRDVYGLKLERAFAQGLKVYATAQSYDDVEGSLPSASATVAPASTRSITSGFAYQEGQLNLSGEIAGSRYQEKFQELRTGHASILDGTYQYDALRFRGGYHNVSPSYVSLAQSVSPGLRESYFGSDWTAATWLTLGAEYRDSNLTTASYTPLPAPAIPPLPPLATIVGTTTMTKSMTSRAAINFGPDLPGWSVTLQDTHTKVTDPTGAESPTTNLLTTLNYSSQTWNGMVSVGSGRVTNSASPQADSKTSTWQAQLGRQFSGATPDMPASWTANASVTAGRQVQDLVNAGTSTTTTNYGLVFAFQRPNSWVINGSLADSIATQPTGGPDLKTIRLQFDASYPISVGLKAPASFKTYWRDNLMNVGDPLLRTRETVIGVLVTYAW
jgi:hypothetical protein